MNTIIIDTNSDSNNNISNNNNKNHNNNGNVLFHDINHVQNIDIYTILLLIIYLIIK